MSSTRGLHNGKKDKRSSTRNPLQNAVHNFLGLYISYPDADTLAPHSLISHPHILPKRYTIYPPLLLLPQGFLSLEAALRQEATSQYIQTETVPWAHFSASLSSLQLDQLWKCIAQAFNKDGVTHIALNAPIELEYLSLDTGGDANSLSRTDNITRSPTGVVGVYGDFGLVPDRSQLLRRSPNVEFDESPNFDAALWVQSVQNGGITQIWAVMFTMFSRGNIKEKARILYGVSSTKQPASISMLPSSASQTNDIATSSTIPANLIFHGLDDVDHALGQSLSDTAVVDMYVGIGYFAFSYLARGVGRVFGFELNAWSVEGLRRGAVKNGWKCKIVELPATDTDRDDMSTSESRPELCPELQDTLRLLNNDLPDPELRLVIFHGDNRWAKIVLTTLEKLQSQALQSPPVLSSSASATSSASRFAPIRHVNLGLLPTSRPSWSDAEAVLSNELGGWIHAHENVEISQIAERAEEVEACFEDLVRSGDRHSDGTGKAGGAWEVKCVHVERVKTYAPGVMHCVFDVSILPRQDKVH